MTPENAKDFGLIDKVVEKRDWITIYSFFTTYTWLRWVSCNIKYSNWFVIKKYE
jgi:hypothetical protein